MNTHDICARMRVPFLILTCVIIISSMWTLAYANNVQSLPVVDAKPVEPNYLWWEKGVKRDSVTNEWDAYANILRDKVPKDPMLREVFVDVFGNSYNNTMFVVLTVTNETIVQKVLMLTDVPEGVHIKFWKGMAPEYKLDEWLGKIHLSELKEIGVPCTAIGKTENGTILISLAEVKPEYVENVQNYVKDKIPLNVIVIRVIPEPVLEDYNQRERPLKAGVEVGGYLNATHIYVSTLNFLVTQAGTSNWYAIISGHSQTDGEDVWQPATADQNDFIGHSDDVAGNRYSDSAIVPLSGVSAYKVVYGPTENTNVIGQKNYAQQNVGNSVTMVGKVSGYRVGTITAKYSEKSHLIYETLYNQVAADYYSQSGDSGGPIIYNYREDGVLKTLAWGIHWGMSGSTRYYSPVDGIETDFNIDFSFG